MCADVGPSHIQGIALAAAFKEVFCPGGRKKGACFSCGKERYFARECRNKPCLQLDILGTSPGHQLVPMGPGLDPPPNQDMSLVSEGKTLGK
jgi:hypothetical protein